MPEYVLLLREKNDVSDDMSPEEIQRAMQRYTRWHASVAERGHSPSGKKLRDGTGRVMEGAGKPVVTDGPYTESHEIIAGFFAFTAESYEQAVELARDCPHLEFGTIEIREVEHTAAS
jgi:hypothetical protein